jgi:hypothetical protein
MPAASRKPSSSWIAPMICANTASMLAMSLSRARTVMPGKVLTKPGSTPVASGGT